MASERRVRPYIWMLVVLLVPVIIAVTWERWMFHNYYRWEFNVFVQHVVNRGLMADWNEDAENFIQHTTEYCKLDTDTEKRDEEPLIGRHYSSCRLVGTGHFLDSCGWWLEGVFCATISTKEEIFQSKNFRKKLETILYDPCAYLRKFKNSQDLGYRYAYKSLNCSTDIFPWLFRVAVIYDDKRFHVYEYVRSARDFREGF